MKALWTALTARPHPASIPVLTVLIEAVACLLRFGFGLRTAVHTAWAGNFTLGLRVHHGFIGIVLVLLALVCFRRRHLWRLRAIYVGLALALSDLTHHFVVLWLITGSPEFHLTYPG